MRTNIKRLGALSLIAFAFLTSCNKNPDANFEPTKSFVTVGTEIGFTNTSISAKSYEWDFGDGTTSTENHPAHTYTAGGTYDVRLTAYSRKEKTASVKTKQVRIADVWSGANTTFTKVDSADWTQAASQDQITPTCHITRAHNQGLFNIALEGTFDYDGPANTRWGLGTTANLEVMNFFSFMQMNQECPPCIVNQPIVLQIVDEGIYIDLTITAWTQNSQGGGFTYTRSTQ